MKSLIFVNTIEEVVDYSDLFEDQKNLIITFNPITSDYIKKKIKHKNCYSIFDFFTKKERLQFFFKSTNILNKELNFLDKELNLKIFKKKGFKKMPYIYLSLKNILYYEFASYYFFEQFLQKNINKKKNK